MKRILTESVSISLMWIATSALKPGLAFASPAVPVAPAPIIAAAAVEAEPSNSDGSAISIEALGIVVTPPKGWQVDMRKSNGMAVIMSEPKVVLTHVKEVITTYQRNITVSVKHEATPIDGKTEATLAEALKREFSKSNMIQDYSIMETKIFDFAPKVKALLVYASFRLNGVNMMHMHVLVSGEEKQFLQTYTDMASRFSTTDAGFTQAWTSITGLQVKGAAPARYENIIKFGSAAGILSILLAAVSFIRHRGRKKLFQASVMALESNEVSENATSHVVSNAWAISAEEEDADSEKMPVTAVNPINDEWQVSAAVALKKAPKIRIKSPDQSAVSQLAEIEKAEAADSESTDWVLPVRTRVSPSRVSVG
jgi:hypothetical protein